MYKKEPYVVIGAGPMGREIARQLATDPGTSVLVLDKKPSALTLAQQLLEAYGNISFDVSLEQDPLVRNARSIIMATSWKECQDLVFNLSHALHKRGRSVPLLCVGRPDTEESVLRRFPSDGPPVILGIGLEPGFVELLIAHIAEEFKDIKTLITHCGGIPCVPEPPLNYTLVFGRGLPIGKRLAFARVNNQRLIHERFEETSSLFVEGLGLLESFDDGMLPSTSVDAYPEIPTLRQRSLRWPGFSEALRMLHKLEFLSDDLLEIGNIRLKRSEITGILLSRPSQRIPTDQIVLDIGLETKEGESGRWSCILRSLLHEQGVSTMALATAIPVAVMVKFLTQHQFFGPLHPWAPVFSDMAPAVISRIRQSTELCLTERATGLLQMSDLFCNNTADIQWNT